MSCEYHHGSEPPSNQHPVAVPTCWNSRSMSARPMRRFLRTLSTRLAAVGAEDVSVASRHATSAAQHKRKANMPP